MAMATVTAVSTFMVLEKSEGKTREHILDIAGHVLQDKSLFVDAAGDGGADGFILLDGGNQSGLVDCFSQFVYVHDVIPLLLVSSPIGSTPPT